jgi:hypothetical protein
VNKYLKGRLEYQRQRRRDRELKGLCTECGKEVAAVGRKSCLDCLEKLRIRNRKRELLKMNILSRKLYYKHRKNRECVKCGIKLIEEENTRCVNCSGINHKISVKGVLHEFNYQKST